MTRRLTLIAALTALLAACGGSQNASNPTSMPTAAEAEAPVETASLRIVNVAMPAPPIRVEAGDTALTTSPLAAGTWTAQRLVVPAGPHALTFAPAGGGDDFASADVELDADGSYTVFFIGDNTSGIRQQMPTAFAVQDALQAPASGMARVRFVHALPGTDVASFSDGAGRGFAAGVAYGTASSWYDVSPDAAVEVAVGGEVVGSFDAPLTAGILTTVVVVPAAGGVSAVYVNDTAP